MKSIRHILADQKGAYFLMSALVLTVMIGFAALGVEIGRWYSIQAEISKSIDGAAFAGAKNTNNPLFAVNGVPNQGLFNTFVQDVAAANFPPGLLGTDTPTFTVTQNGPTVQVTGDVNSYNALTTVFDAGTDTTNLAAAGSAQLRRAEVSLVLDISGSMGRPAGSPPIVELQAGASAFVNNFQSFQKDHRFSLIYFDAGVVTPNPNVLSHDFVDGMTTTIAGLTPNNGGTNIEHALTQARAIDWTPGQMAAPANTRISQVLVLFSDGEPTAFRGDFTYKGAQHEGVGQVFVNGGVVAPDLKEAELQNTNYSSPSINRMARTGNGQSSGPCGSSSVKWHIFNDPVYGFAQAQPPVSAGVEQCDVGNPYYNGGKWYAQFPLDDYVRWVAQEKAKDHAQDLKDMGIEIYTIGLDITAGGADETFMKGLATDPDHAFFVTDQSELQGIFQTIANRIKLILVS